MSVSIAASAPLGVVPRTGQGSERSAQELTTVTTQCDKKHWHDQSCPHTVSTRPAPEPGAAGRHIDVWA